MTHTENKTKHCGTCEFAQSKVIPFSAGRRQWYCQWILQVERSKSNGNENRAFVHYKDTACEHYFPNYQQTMNKQLKEKEK